MSLALKAFGALVAGIVGGALVSFSDRLSEQ